MVNIIAHSHRRRIPSDTKYMENEMASKKNPTSLINDLGETLNGLTIAIDPVTTAVINEAAPMSSPIANDPDPARMAAYVENTSGEPLPNAKKVTPARDSDRPSIFEIVLRLGQR